MESLIQKILTEENSISNKYLSEQEKEEYLKIVASIKKEHLYKSKIHGLYHSEKVCLFAFIIGKSLGLNDLDMQIITDAALYHDIGRQNDTNDTIHGFSSAYRIDKVVDNKIYQDENNLNMLKSIVDSHSVPDDRSYSSFCYYFDCYDDTKLSSNPHYQKFVLLNKVIKDADGLDRNRFVDGYSFGLDERFLRLDISKKLINLSREINDIYTDCYAKEVDLKNVKGHYFDCLHGIGFDFFKIDSILENGILSASTLRDKKIEGVKNFSGGNARNWVSVVDASLTCKGYTGYETFIKKGISFICNNQFLVEPMKYSDRSLAMEKGLPYNKSDHEDERYVYREIKADDIKKIIISNELSEKSIDDACFVFNCLDFRNFLERISYYIDKTNAKEYGYDEEKLQASLLEYKIELDRYNDIKFANVTYDGQKLVVNLTMILNKINCMIIDMIKVYYCNKIKVAPEQLNVKEIIEYELSSIGKEYQAVTVGDSTIFSIKEKTKKQISNLY